MEVDHAAPLVFGDLGELHPHQLPGRGLGEPQVLGELAAQGDGEPPPQFRRPPLPDQMGGVVVAVDTQRLPGGRVGVVVDGHAPQRPAVRAEPAPVAGSGGAAAAAGPAGLLRGVHRSEGGCGEGGEHQRMRGHGRRGRS